MNYSKVRDSNFEGVQLLQQTALIIDRFQELRIEHAYLRAESFKVSSVKTKAG